MSLRLCYEQYYLRVRREPAKGISKNIKMPLVLPKSNSFIFWPYESDVNFPSVSKTANLLQ